MKKLMWAALALSLMAATSFAQNTPKADVGVGYAYLHLNGSTGVPGVNANGLNGSVAYNVTSILGVVGDFGFYHASVAGVGANLESYTFGPRFNFRKNDKFTPYAQALFGGGHASSSGTGTNAFAFAFGGGTDINIAKDGAFGLRPEFDFIGLRNSGVTTKTERIAIGIVYHIGQK